jgi:5-aminolevulinate synthase
VFLSDADNHASLIEGMRHSRAAERRIFRHNSVEHLEECLRKTIGRPKLVVFESVYSMSGSIAPIKQICAAARRHGALTILDEVHALGMYGSRGAGNKRTIISPLKPCFLQEYESTKI